MLAPFVDEGEVSTSYNNQLLTTKPKFKQTFVSKDLVSRWKKVFLMLLTQLSKIWYILFKKYCLYCKLKLLEQVVMDLMGIWVYFQMIIVISILVQYFNDGSGSNSQTQPTNESSKIFNRTIWLL